MRKKISNNQLAQVLYEVTVGTKGEQTKKAIHEFVRLLKRIHKVSKALNIITEFEKYAKKRQGIVNIEIQSARELDEKTLLNIKKIFSTKGGSVLGGGVEASESIDQCLLGGIKVKTEDKILDASLKTQLNQLKQFLA